MINYKFRVYVIAFIIIIAYILLRHENILSVVYYYTYCRHYVWYTRSFQCGTFYDNSIR